MADNLTVDNGSLSDYTVRSRDTGSSIQAQKTDVAPWFPTIVAGNQSLTISTGSTALTVPSTATHALISVDGGDVRFWEDGTAPTASAGIYLASGFVGELPVSANFKLIRTGSVDASVQVSYRKYV
jgi:hypothetical protein